MAVSYHEEAPGAAFASRKTAAGGRPSRGTMRSLTLLLFASLAVPALLFAVATWQNHRLLFEEGTLRAQRTAAILEQQATSTFQLYHQIFDRVEERIAADPEASPGAIQAYLSSLDDGLEQVEGIFLVDATGHITHHSRSSRVPDGNSVADRDYFRVLQDLEHDEVAIAAPAICPVSGRRVLNVAHRLLTSDGSFAGVVGLTAADGYFENFHRTLSASPTDAMILLRDDGVILARSPVTPDVPFAMTAAVFREAIATAGAGVWHHFSVADHRDRIFAFRKLPGFPLYVAYGLDTGEIMARWWRNSLIYGAVAGVGALALFAVTWIALVRTRREEAAVRQREAAEDALRQAQKMEAVGQLTGGVAHDFNHLLGVISTNIELAAGVSENTVARERLEAALRAVDRGHQTTQRLLAFSRRRPLRTIVTDLRQKLPELVELVEPSVGRQVALEVDAAPDLWPVEVDDGELQVAVLNLVVNARDAMPDGGTVRIAVRNAVPPDGDRPAPLQGLPPEVVEISVADDGTGIPPAILSRIFEPFFTTKDEGHGSGLGLAQVYGFAKQSNGAVTVESELGRGTVFTLYLPRCASAAPTTAPPPRPPLARPEDRRLAGAPRILVVDDDEAAADAAAALLTSLGCRVAIADSARRALGTLAEDPAFDLVFSDIAMPDGMSGIELAAVIGHRHSGLPVLLATGDPQRARLAAAAGHEVLQKPYAVDTLRDALRRHLQEGPGADDRRAGRRKRHRTMSA